MKPPLFGSGLWCCTQAQRPPMPWLFVPFLSYIMLTLILSQLPVGGFIGDHPWSLWNPAAGLRLAMSLLFGAFAAPFICLDILFHIVGDRGGEATGWGWLWAIGPTAIYLAGGVFLRRIASFDMRLRRVGDVGWLALVALAVALLVALDGAVSGILSNPRALLASGLSDWLGILSVTPLALVLLPKAASMPLEDSVAPVQSLCGGTTCRLAKDRAPLRALIDSMPDLIYYKDCSGHYLGCNKAFEDFIGQVEENILGKTCADCFTPKFAVMAGAMDRQTLERGERQAGRIWADHANDGCRVLHEHIKTPFYNPDGKLIGIVGIARDITAQHWVEKEIEARASQQAVIAELGQHALAGIISLSDLVDEVVGQIVKTLNVDISSVFMYDDAEYCFEMLHGVGWDAKTIKPDSMRALGTSLVGYTVQAGEPVIVEDLALEKRFVGARMLYDNHVVSGASVLIEGVDTPFGVLYALTHNRRIFRKDEVHFLQSVAALLGSAFERERNLDALRRSEDQYRRIVETSAEGVCLLNERYELTYVNTRMAEMLGRDAQEMIGQSLLEYVDDEGRDGAGDFFASCRFFSRTQADLKFRHNMGASLWSLVSLSPILDEAGRFEGALAMLLDISQRKQVEKAHERLAWAVDQAAEIFIIIDTQGYIQYVNPTFERITGYSPGDVLGLNLQDIQNGGISGGQCRQIWKTLRSGGIWSGHLDSQKKDGSQYAEEVTISPARNERNEIISYLVIKRDVSRFVELEDQLRHSQKMDAMGRLASGVAHDFNNLLTAILGHTDLVLMRSRETIDERTLHDLKEVKGAAERATALTRQLLTFSRRQHLKIRVFSLNCVIGELESLLRRLIGEDVTLQTHLGDCPQKINADPGQIEQVVMNLVVNARDAMPRGGTITIKTDMVTLAQPVTQPYGVIPAGDYISLRVTDEGCGMDAKTLSHIFEPFFTTKDSGKGTGLGLSIVYGIVKQSCGYIQVQSELNQGTTMTIYIPQANQGEENAPSVKALKPLHHKGETILVVEDEPIVRHLINDTLCVNNYKILLAENGEEALGLFEEHRDEIQLVISDVVMPRMNGRDMVERIKAIRPELKVLFMSGYTDDALFQRKIRKSGMAFLQKPFTTRGLICQVRSVLDGGDG